MASRALVLDANIVIRAVLGNRVRRILEKYADRASFFIPEYAYVEAEEHLVNKYARVFGELCQALILNGLVSCGATRPMKSIDIVHVDQAGFV